MTLGSAQAFSLAQKSSDWLRSSRPFSSSLSTVPPVKSRNAYSVLPEGGWGGRGKEKKKKEEEEGGGRGGGEKTC